jgi:hypothetical protein
MPNKYRIIPRYVGGGGTRVSFVGIVCSTYALEQRNERHRSTPSVRAALRGH